MKPLLTLAAGALALVCNAQTRSEWFISGYVDGYYQCDFGRPLSGDSVNGRGLDIAHNRIRLANAELDISKPPTAKRPFGLTVQFYGGKDADLIHLAEPGGSDKYKFVRQAFVSYAVPESKNSVQIDLGKFDTWIGYEGMDNRLQDEYSRSFNWTYAEPTYEAGLRVTGKLNAHWNGSFFLVRGWNEVEDGNNRPSIGVALTYSPDERTMVTLQNHLGDEGSDRANEVGLYGGIGFARPGHSRVHLLDFIVTRQLTDRTKVALNLDYATSASGSNDGSWNGEVLYFKHQVAPKQAVGLRFDRFEDKDGLRVGTPIQLYSLTGTYDVTLCDNVQLRFELRRDFASQTLFDTDSGPSQNRTTLTAAALFKF